MITKSEFNDKVNARIRELGWTPEQLDVALIDEIGETLAWMNQMAYEAAEQLGNDLRTERIIREHPEHLISLIPS